MIRIINRTKSLSMNDQLSYITFIYVSLIIVCSIVVGFFFKNTIQKSKFVIPYIIIHTIIIEVGFYMVISYNFDTQEGSFLKTISILEVFLYGCFVMYYLYNLQKENRKLTKELKTYISHNKYQSFYFLLEENALTNTTFTIQEVRVLKCIHQGMSNSEIAETLFVSYNTIKFHIKNIYKKLEVKNRKEIQQKLFQIQIE